MSILSYQGNQFYMDGKPFVVRSGAMHYFRIPQEYWHDRLLKLKECGFNTVETYTCWNLHEPREGEFCFFGMLDIVEYVKTAAALGLYVILRPGPYICAEWDFGGLPAWLLKYRDMELRCMDNSYLEKVRRYYTELLKRLRPHFAANGGNIIMLQIENEYGSYGNDKQYLNAILDLYREMEIDCLFFTSDGPSHTMLTGGTLPGILSVANFGSNPEQAWQIMHERFPDQPFMCGEYWDGWFDHWGEAAHSRNPDEVVSDLKTFVDNDWSINVYMFHGGTSFGFTNGANSNYPDQYEPTISSYDYGALLTEAGDRTESYYRVRQLLVDKYGDAIPPLTARESIKKAYGKVELNEQAFLFDQIDHLSAPMPSRTPKYMEDIGQSFGYLLYRTTINGPFNDWKFHFDVVHDRAHVFVNGEKKATYYRADPVSEWPELRLPLAEGESAQLDILVENMGRINYGRRLRDRKGMVGMSFGNQFHFGWDHYPLPMDNLDALVFSPTTSETVEGPVFLRGKLTLCDSPCDTFLRLDGFTKGFVTVNGFNLGRYWAIGPTKTLYIPAPMLRKGENEIIVFESDATSRATVELVAEPDLGR